MRFGNFSCYMKHVGEFGFPMMDNRVVEADDSKSAIIIPCPTTDPRAKIELHKIIPESPVLLSRLQN